MFIHVINIASSNISAAYVTVKKITLRWIGTAKCCDRAQELLQQTVYAYMYFTMFCWLSHLQSACRV